MCLGETFDSLLDRNGFVWLLGFFTALQNIQDNSSVQDDLLCNPGLHFAEYSTCEYFHLLLIAERLHFVVMKKLGCTTGLLLTRGILRSAYAAKQRVTMW